jgi:hypothetical protein
MVARICTGAILSCAARKVADFQIHPPRVCDKLGVCNASRRKNLRPALVGWVVHGKHMYAMT